MNNYSSMYGASSRGPPNINGPPFIDDSANVRLRYPDISQDSSNQYPSSPWPYSSTQPTPFPDLGLNYAHQTAPTLTQYPATGYAPSYDPRTVNMQGYDATYAPPYAQTQGTAAQTYQPPVNPYGHPDMTVQTGQTYILPQSNVYYTPQHQHQPQAPLLQHQPQPQPTTHIPDYLATFDPISSNNQGWDGTSRPPTNGQTRRRQSVTSPPSNQPQHPRDYIRTYKTDLEAWDPYTWKQVLNMFERLKEAWERRRAELSKNANEVQMRLQFGYSSPHEGSRLQQMFNEASSYADNAAASFYQMSEVFNGYRQSADPASKRRVRESCNAALKNLPDWPGPLDLS